MRQKIISDIIYEFRESDYNPMSREYANELARIIVGYLKWHKSRGKRE